MNEIMDLLLSSPNMMPLVLGIIIALCLGIIIGVLVANLGDRKEVKTTRDDLFEELRIWRSKEYRTLHIEFDEKIFNSDGDLTVNQYKRLKMLSTELRSWLGLPEDHEEQSDRRIPPSILHEKVNDQEVIQEVESKPKRMNFIEAVSRAVRPTSTEEAAKPTSLAGEVDEILQEKLVLSGMKDRTIRLIEIPERGMVVVVGMNQYEFVDDVPDDDVRKIIKEAVLEWEQRHSIE